MYGTWSDPLKQARVTDSQRPKWFVQESYVPFTYSRSGRNAKASALSAVNQPSPEDPWVLKTYRDPQGRFVDELVRVRKNGTPVFRRKPVYVTRLVQQRSKVRAIVGPDLPPNPLDYLINQVSIPDDKVSYWWKGTSGTMSGAIGIIPFTVSSQDIAIGLPRWFTQKATSAVMTYHHTVAHYLGTGSAHSKALSKLYAETQDMKANIAVMLAEAKQTAASIIGAIKDVTEMIHAIKSGKFIKFFKGGFTKKKISGRWLEAVYGIAPLISDINGCIEAIRQGRKPIIQDVNGRGKTVSDEELVSESSNIYSSTQILRRVTVRVRYKVRIQVVNQGSKLLNETGLDNSPAVFWEKLPWSFVLDWVLPVGNYLETRDAFTGTRTMFVTRTTSVLSEIRVVRSFKTTGDPNFHFLESKEVESKFRRFEVKREILGSIPSLDLPTFKNPVSGMHFANSLALLIQKFSKH